MSGKTKAIIGIVVAVVVLIAVIAGLVSFLTAPKYSTPKNAYDIAGVVGMNPADMNKWFTSNKFTSTSGGEDELARVVIDGSKEVAGNEDPSKNTGWKTLSAQGYTMLSAAPSGSGVSNIFDNSSSMIAPSKLATSKPRAALFASTERAKSSSDLPSSTNDYLTKIVGQASLTAASTKENKGKSYAIGTCKIAGEDGIWVAFAEKESGGYNGFILCGYADDMKKSLGITSADAAGLDALLGTSSSSSSASSSSSLSSSSSSSSSSKSSSSSSKATSAGGSGGNSGTSGSSSLAGSWKDPQYGDTMTLSNDGTGVIVQDGKRFSGTWRATSNGMVFELAGGKSYTFALGGSTGKMKLYNNDKQLYFEKVS